jgi:DMSO/TMAO reductase YedYZ heme-binding membrane subunit
MLAFVATPLHRLNPGRVSAFLLRHRSAIGVTFGFSMAIHVAFIVRLFVLHAPHQPPMVTSADFYIGIPGLVLVALMTITSAAAIRRRLGPQRWNRLHRVGLYFVWAVFFLCLIDSVNRKAPSRPLLEYYSFILVLTLGMIARMWAARHPAVATASAGVTLRRDGRSRRARPGA